MFAIYMRIEKMLKDFEGYECDGQIDIFEYEKQKNTKEDLVQDKEKEFILKLLADEDKTLICLAYSYARNLLKYGADVTEKWETAAEQSDMLQAAYSQGYLDGIKTKDGVKGI